MTATPGEIPRSEATEATTTPVITNEFWEEDGACKGKDENFWTENPDGSMMRKPIRGELEDQLIGKYCLNCMSMMDCRADSLLNRDEYGVKGGLSADERKPLLRSMKKNGSLPVSQWMKEHQFRAPKESTRIEKASTAAPAKQRPVSAASHDQLEPLKQTSIVTTPRLAKQSQSQPAEMQPFDIPAESLRGRIQLKLGILATLKQYPADQVKEQRLAILKEIADLQKQAQRRVA